MGSPPPMRGKVYAIFSVLSPTGITPAYAGKRTGRRNPRIPHKDHPRLCGEKLMIDLSVLWVRGSPPPMRGKAIRHAINFPEHRITPAYAGKSCGRRRNHDQHRDHPRLCGEKHALLIRLPRSQGITPAYAGKSAVLEDNGDCV